MNNFENMEIKIQAYGSESFRVEKWNMRHPEKKITNVFYLVKVWRIKFGFCWLPK